eukprot:XP_014790459.1 PREDICTED: uncharacterized protein LOC106883835 [Octopus bimaculoides]
MSISVKISTLVKIREKLTSVVVSVVKNVSRTSAKHFTVAFFTSENAKFFMIEIYLQTSTIPTCNDLGHHIKYLIGPYFFEGTVNQQSYLSVLRKWFVPQLLRLNIDLNDYWFQQDGALPHYAITVQEYLNEVLQDRWIGQGSQQHPAPVEWAPRSSDLTSCDNALWGIIMERVSHEQYQNTHQLKDAVQRAFEAITKAQLRKISHRKWHRIILCDKNNGVHTDLLDV